MVANNGVRRKWTEDVPPPRARGGAIVDHRLVAEEAKKHPGMWTRVRNYGKSEDAASVAYKVRNGRLSSYGEGFDAVARTDSEGHGLWIRWVGGDGDVGHS